MNPTVQQLLNDEALLRQTAAKVLCPKPWAHMMVWDGCWHCGKTDAVEGGECDVPPWILTDAGRVASLCEIAEMLTKACDINRLAGAIHTYCQRYLVGKVAWECTNEWRWFGAIATPLERIICCLLALGECEVEGEQG